MRYCAASKRIGRAFERKGPTMSDQPYNAEGTVHDGPRSRRQLLKLAGVAGAAGAAALVVRPGAAGAANNDPMLIGVANTGTLGTSLENTGAGSAFVVEGIPTNAAGWGLAAIGKNFTNSTGQTLGGDVKLLGTGRLQFFKNAASGQLQPPFTPGSLGAAVGTEIVVSDTGILWTGTSNPASAANPWRRINAVRVDKANGTGSPFVPARLIDTVLAANGTHVVTVAGVGGVPKNAIAIFGNLTALPPTATFTTNGSMTLYPTGFARPPVPNVNMSLGSRTVSNFFFCALGGGKITVFSTIKVHFRLDAYGYMQ
jgi:hypothetical protein